jgi:hypothetical protein
VAWCQLIRARERNPEVSTGDGVRVMVVALAASNMPRPLLEYRPQHPFCRRRLGRVRPLLSGEGV